MTFGTGLMIGGNTGHGHIWKRLDGKKARCGGPHFCELCKRDLATLQEIDGLCHEPPNAPPDLKVGNCCLPANHELLQHEDENGSRWNVTIISGPFKRSLEIGDLVVYNPSKKKDIEDNPRYVVIGVIPATDCDNELVWLTTPSNNYVKPEEPTIEEAGDCQKVTR